MRWQILQMKWKLEFIPSSPKKSPWSIASFITADSFSPFHCIHECNFHNTASLQPYASHSAECGLELFIFIFSLGLSCKTESMSQPAEWKHLISIQGRYWGKLSLCDSSQSTPLIIMAHRKENASEMGEKKVDKKITAFSNIKKLYKISGSIE